MTHEEFIFQCLVMGYDLRAEIINGKLKIPFLPPVHIRDTFTVLPDNMFIESFSLYSTLTKIPENLEVLNFYCTGNTLCEEVPKSTIIHMDQCYSNSTIKYLNHLSSGSIVYGDLDLENSLVQSLPDDLTINGYLDVSYSSIKQLPKNIKIIGALFCTKKQVNDPYFFNSNNPHDINY